MVVDVIRNIAKKLYAHEPQLYPEDAWDDTLELRINRIKLDHEALLGERFSYAQCVKAGLLLWNESLDASHAISESIENATGSYFHGLMHRMEGDYSNAKYWFYKAGALPVFEQLQSGVSQLLTAHQLSQGNFDERILHSLMQLQENQKWDPNLLVDTIQLEVMKVQLPASQAILQKIQFMELQLLLQYSYTESFGGNLFDDV